MLWKYFPDKSKSSFKICMADLDIHKYIVIDKSLNNSSAYAVIDMDTDNFNNFVW